MYLESLQLFLYNICPFLKKDESSLFQLAQGRAPSVVLALSQYSFLRSSSANINISDVLNGGNDYRRNGKSTSILNMKGTKTDCAKPAPSVKNVAVEKDNIVVQKAPKQESSSTTEAKAVGFITVAVDKASTEKEDECICLDTSSEEEKEVRTKQKRNMRIADGVAWIGIKRSTDITKEETSQISRNKDLSEPDFIENFVKLLDDKKLKTWCCSFGMKVNCGRNFMGQKLCKALSFIFVDGVVAPPRCANDQAPANTNVGTLSEEVLALACRMVDRQSFRSSSTSVQTNLQPYMVSHFNNDNKQRCEKKTQFHANRSSMDLEQTVVDCLRENHDLHQKIVLWEPLDCNSALSFLKMEPNNLELNMKTLKDIFLQRGIVHNHQL